MSYFVTSRWGAEDSEPSEDRLREVLAELDTVPDDEEHGEVSLSHESGWTLSLSIGGTLVWEDIESDDAAPRHMTDVSKEKTLGLWLRLADSDFDAIEREPWRSGYGPSISDQERSRLIADAERSTLARHREFFDSLDPERPDVPCRTDGCTRGAIPLSIFCRAHHFESIFKMKCPFV